MRTLWTILVVLSGSVIACGGKDGAPQTAVTAEAACARYSQAYCAKLMACAPTNLAVDFGTVDSCARQLGRACPETFLPGSADSPAVTDGCGKALEAATCATFGNACDGMFGDGTLANGVGCQSDVQCKSGRCSRPQDGGCGVCRAGGKKGDPCGRFDPCGTAPGVSCFFGGDTGLGECHATLPAGQPCGATELDDCDGGSFCNQAGVCESRRSLGAPCTAIECDFDARLECQDDGKCGPARRVAIGQACSDTAFCGGDSYCDSVTHLCVAYALEGAPCNAAGPYCEWDLQCKNGHCATETPVCQ